MYVLLAFTLRMVVIEGQGENEKKTVCFWERRANKRRGSADDDDDETTRGKTEN